MAEATVEDRRTANVALTGLDPKTAPYFVSNGSFVGCKGGDFFRDQGGLTEEWGSYWTPIDGTSIGDARRKGAKLFGRELSHIYAGEE